MSRVSGATLMLWICGLSICTLWRPVQAAEAVTAGAQDAKNQLGDLEAARNAAERAKADSQGRGNGAVLEAHKQLIDFETKQQKDLVAREAELQEVRNQVASLKTDVEKLQAAAKQRDAELAERAKQRESLETKSREELAALRSQLEKLEASTAAERKDHEKALADAKRLERRETEARSAVEPDGQRSTGGACAGL